MLYEVFFQGNRIEFVEASSKEDALIEAHLQCEDDESILYIREKNSSKFVWAYSMWIFCY